MRALLIISFLFNARVLASENCFRKLLNAVVQSPREDVPDVLGIQQALAPSAVPKAAPKPVEVFKTGNASSSDSGPMLLATSEAENSGITSTVRGLGRNEEISLGQKVAKTKSSVQPADENENMFAAMAEKHARAMKEEAYNWVDNVPGKYVRVNRPLSQLDHELAETMMRNPTQGSFKEAAGVELLDASGKTIYKTPIVVGDEEAVEMIGLIKNKEFAAIFNKLRPAGIRFTHTHPPKMGDIDASKNRALFSLADVQANAQYRKAFDAMGLQDVEIQATIIYIEPEVAVNAIPEMNVTNAIREKTFIVPSEVHR